MGKKRHLIFQVLPGSIGEEAGLKPGDEIVSINGDRITDIFDYQFLIEDEYLEILIRSKGGEEWVLEVEKDADEDLGLVFENGLMDEYRSCRNKCIFCFIDQMPPGMRDTLYFKDDDSRLSFLQGNYITLTNMGREDIDRIIQYHLAPINISVHTTNPGLRCKMLHNRFAGQALGHIETLYKSRVPMNGQIVLCKGWNDGEELERTIRDLGKYCPVMESVSVVPVGLTKYRDGLEPLQPFEKKDGERVVDLIEKFQKRFYGEFGLHFVHASDEFYLLAGRPIPESGRYDGYPQLENGVGMLRLLEDESEEALEAVSKGNLEGELGLKEKETHEKRKSGGMEKRAWKGEVPRKISCVTAKLAAPYIRGIAARVMERFPKIEIEVLEITNTFFGEQITVSGLLTGKDLLEQLAGRSLGEELLLPANMLKSDEAVLLDDITISQLEKALQVPVIIVKSTGYGLVSALLGKDAPASPLDLGEGIASGAETERLHQPYEIE